MKMENYINTLATGRHEAEMRRSAIITVICLITMVALVACGVWMLIAFGSELLFYIGLGLAAMLYDPFRRHLNP